MALTPRETAALNTVAARIGVPPSWLFALINFESRWNPLASNPKSSARGLIQFTNTTARDLGFKDSTDLIRRFPARETQLLGPVSRYLESGKPYKSDFDLFMQVFYPIARKDSPHAILPASVQRVNPGIVTPQDYVDRVWGRKKGGMGLGIVAALAVLLYLVLSKGRRSKI